MMGTGCPVYCSGYRVSSVFEPRDGKPGIFERSFLGVFGLLAMNRVKSSNDVQVGLSNNVKYQIALNHQETTKND